MTTRNSPLVTERSRLFSALERKQQVDLIIIGGGATGLGLALDAVLRGLTVVLLEAYDLAKGTSSRATKLVHGGVRYLAQGDICLVREALRERKQLLRNASHLAQPLAFVMPSYSRLEIPFYAVGLNAYDLLAGPNGLGHTQVLASRRVQELLPGVRTAGLKGGIKYWDGQFDDARLALALARSAAAQGALILNYAPVMDILHDNGRVTGVRCKDSETEREYDIYSPCVINATGVWVDDIRQMDGKSAGRESQAMVSPSQGVHLVVEQHFLNSEHALLVPKTRDGRVLFAVPWLGKLILGTTDTAVQQLDIEPRPLRAEVDFILSEAGKYLQRAPQRSDVLSVWAGLRPLVKPPSNEGGDTKKLSREHTVLVSPSGLVSVTGGKWTTYRSMAENVLEKCVHAGLLASLPASRTADFRLIGSPLENRHHSMAHAPNLEAYGSEADWVQSLPGADIELYPGLSVAMIRFACRYEYARNLEDMLARRFRLLFLDARQAARIAPEVASVMQEELACDPQLEAFLQLCEQYSTVP